MASSVAPGSVFAIAVACVASVLIACGSETTTLETVRVESVRTSEEPPGSNCPAGGLRLDRGLDDDRDGTLDADEVRETSYLCGLQGLTSLTSVTEVDPGAECPAGGQRIETGLDADRDGTLDPDEVEQTRFVCSVEGLRTLTVLTEESPGDNCLAGGQRVDVGLDANRNGVLDDSEITETFYVCARAPLFIDTESDLTAKIAMPYGERLEAIGGTGGRYAWEVVDGVLPAGVTLTPEGTPFSELTGVPTETGVFEFEIRVTDRIGQTTRERFRLEVTDPLRITTGRLPTLVPEEPYAVQLDAAGGSGSGQRWSLVGGDLPDGLQLGSDGELRGQVADANVARLLFFEVSDSSGATARRALRLFSPVRHVGVTVQGPMRNRLEAFRFDVVGDVLTSSRSTGVYDQIRFPSARFSPDESHVVLQNSHSPRRTIIHDAESLVRRTDEIGTWFDGWVPRVNQAVLRRENGLFTYDPVQGSSRLIFDLSDTDAFIAFVETHPTRPLVAFGVEDFTPFSETELYIHDVSRLGEAPRRVELFAGYPTYGRWIPGSDELFIHIRTEPGDYRLDTYHVEVGAQDRVTALDVPANSQCRAAPHGRHLACVSPDRLSVVDLTQAPFEVTEPSEDLSMARIGNPYLIEWSPDGRTLAVLAEDVRRRLWGVFLLDPDQPTRAPLPVYAVEPYVDIHTAWSRSGATLYVALEQGPELLAFDVEEGVLRTVFGSLDNAFRTCASPDGAWLILPTSSGAVLQSTAPGGPSIALEAYAGGEFLRDGSGLVFFEQVRTDVPSWRFEPRWLPLQSDAAGVPTPIEFDLPESFTTSALLVPPFDWTAFAPALASSCLNY